MTTIKEIEKGCGRSFIKEIKIDNGFTKEFYFLCGKWKEISYAHSHMDWCEVCKAKLQTKKEDLEMFKLWAYGKCSIEEEQEFIKQLEGKQEGGK